MHSAVSRSVCAVSSGQQERRKWPAPRKTATAFASRSGGGDFRTEFPAPGGTSFAELPQSTSWSVSMWIPQSETPMQFDRELVPKKQSGSTLQPSSHERPRSRLGSSSGEKKSAPSKTLLNFWLDTFLLLNFVTLLYVATVVRFVFPAGTVADDWTLWGFSFDAWSDLQFVLLGILAMGITVHVMLHWPWVCGVLASRLLPRGAACRVRAHSHSPQSPSRVLAPDRASSGRSRPTAAPFHAPHPSRLAPFIAPLICSTAPRRKRPADAPCPRSGTAPRPASRSGGPG